MCTSCLSAFLQVDLKAVAAEWGLTPNATRMRFLRLGAYIEKLQNAEQSEKDVPMNEAQEDEDEDGDENSQEDNETEVKTEAETLKEHLLADSAYALEG